MKTKRKDTFHYLTLGILAALSLGQAANAAIVQVQGGLESIWLLTDEVTTDNAQPLGGACSFTSPGMGAGLVDASLSDQSDAFDWSSMIWVEGVQVAGNLAVVDNEASFGTQTIEPFDVSLTMNISQTTATARILLELVNTGDSVAMVEVQYVVNYGSDDTTSIISTSDGDAAFGKFDNWVISDDAVVDPANTTVISGGSDFSAMVDAVSSETFNCFGNEGIYARLEHFVEPGESVYFLFFQQLNASAADALNWVSNLEGHSILSTDLLDDIPPDQLDRIVNWSFEDDYTVFDQDGDGVLNDDDVCPYTEIPEQVPYSSLRRNRHALTGNGPEFGAFETSSSRRNYSLEDTSGCSCEQILDRIDSDSTSQYNHGCTAPTMIRWERKATDIHVPTQPE
ncbi:hypothetical protein ACUNV4_29820 [Granulosicoccus sp. 3-233]|uniref:hypothetical protein n=1 Tax=Granulosicoccus sp. 3-233 TaxID=3417969 RepID=UPI003D3395C8